MPRTIRTLLFVLVVLLVLALLAGPFLFTSRTAPFPPLPSPNGYSDFLRAAAVVTGEVGNAPTFNHDGLRGLVSTNAEALRLLHLGLTRPCALDAKSAMTNVNGMLSELAALKQLAQPRRH